jgi:hypothetical protein
MGASRRQNSGRPVPRPEVPALPGVLSAEQIDRTAAGIERVQRADGAIPWYNGGHVDPWDHVECAMALAAAGRADAAMGAYRWLASTQRADGSWPARVRGTVVEDAAAETNQCAYVAVGLWHQLLITGDIDAVAALWPTVQQALDFVCATTTDSGDIAWSRSSDGTIAEETLLTGSSSTYQALRCGLALAERMDAPQPEWELAVAALGDAIATRPESFADKRRFAMDWYYPVLGGAVRGAAGRRRIAERWDDFVVAGLGIRCVDDQPWVTGAETCELVLALDCLGDRDAAVRLLADVQHLREPDGSYWTGWQFALSLNWPDEHTTWTAAAVILAADALSRTSPGNGIFRAAGLPALPTPPAEDLSPTQTALVR